MTEKQISDEAKLTELMSQLSNDQKELNKLRTILAQRNSENVDHATEQALMLQLELNQQGEYFRRQEGILQNTIDELSEELKAARMAEANFINQFNGVFAMVGELKQENSKLLIEQAQLKRKALYAEKKEASYEIMLE